MNKVLEQLKQTLLKLSAYVATLQTSPQAAQALPQATQQPKPALTLPLAPKPVPVASLSILQAPWSDPVVAHHNVRVICDQELLTYDQKEILTACVFQESAFHINAVNHNTVIEADGTRRITSTDNGICQWNDYFHGKEITPDEALHNPEKAIRLMCAYWKAGRMKQWVSYSSGAYKKWLGKV
jgi:hypothetical protein